MTTNTRWLFFLMTAGLLFSFSNLPGSPYEVILIRGTVFYQGIELRKGSLIEVPDLRVPAIFTEAVKNFTFAAPSDEVQLFDREKRKIVLVSARNRQPGKDLMLATRGIKTFRSDFEFQRAFSPGGSPVTLITEDTLLCHGLIKFRFNGDNLLAVRYTFKDKEHTRIIGRNDSLFLTRHHLFGSDASGDGETLNSFETFNLHLLMINRSTGEEKPLPAEFNPFSLFFLDDIISYLGNISYQGTGMDEEEIFKTIMPGFVKVRQIQQEFSLFTEEEAHAWLRDKIQQVIAQPGL